MKHAPSRETMIRTTITALLLSVVFVLALGVRLTWLSSQHVRQANIAIDQNEIAQGFDSLNRAIRNYYPGNPYAKQAVEVAIFVIENHSDDRNEDLHQLRGSLLSIRSLYQPYNKEVEWIETKLSESRE